MKPVFLVCGLCLAVTWCGIVYKSWPIYSFDKFERIAIIGISAGVLTAYGLGV